MTSGMQEENSDWNIGTEQKKGGRAPDPEER
jgi:hypothetical protein